MAEKAAVTFVSSRQPALESGEYRITVTQTVTSTDPEIPLSDSLTDKKYVSVRGQRFSFDPAVIYSVYPPRNARGDFSRHLPHVVLKRRTILWERDLLEQRSKDPVYPWLALLSLRADEGLVEHDQMKVRDLRAVSPEIVSYNLANLDFGESDDDLCAAIDVTPDLFRRVAPSLDDMPWLAHARQIKTGSNTDEFSVIAGNRLSAAGEYIVHLVSLHGLGKYLPGGSGPLAPTVRFIRLVSLRRWTFTNAPVAHTFRSFLENLNRDADGGAPATDKNKPRRVRFATMRSARATSGLPEDARRAMSLGFIPFNHHLRNGDDAVSWYRGPLVGYAIPLAKRRLASSADAALRYDQGLGMFDASYAAAWQLGRLLALSSTSFCASLLQWKKTTREKARQFAMAATQEDLKAHVAGVLNPAVGKIPEVKLAAQGATLETFDKLRTPAKSAPTLPDDISEWLRRLCRLHSTPFDYLVADAAMLPSESIQFFYLDPNWISYLVDGAYSVGDNSMNSITQDETFAPIFQAAATTAAAFGSVTTGCLLRSGAVADWPGIQVNAFDASGVELKVLRSSIIQPNVLLVLFNGVIASVEIHQPPEGTHAGVDRLVDKAVEPAAVHDFEIHLRSLLETGTGREIVDEHGVHAFATGKFRNKELRVIDVAVLAASVEGALRKQKVLADVDKLNAATFAVQLIQGVDMVEFQLT